MCTVTFDCWIKVLISLNKKNKIIILLTPKFWMVPYLTLITCDFKILYDGLGCHVNEFLHSVTRSLNQRHFCVRKPAAVFQEHCTPLTRLDPFNPFYHSASPVFLCPEQAETQTNQVKTKWKSAQIPWAQLGLYSHWVSSGTLLALG